MAKKQTESSVGEALEEIQSVGDRASEWISNNPILILGAMAGILVIAGGIGLVSSGREGARLEASRDLAKAQAEFRLAMGGSPDRVEVPEPANLETARKVREEYSKRFATISSEHEGTAAGAFAALEAGDLEVALGQTNAAIQRWERAVSQAEGTPRAFLHLRIAAAHEETENWAEAAAQYETAAGIAGYPLRAEALADAARCAIEAGDLETARRLHSELEAIPDAPPLPDHTAAMLQELELR